MESGNGKVRKKNVWEILKQEDPVPPQVKPVKYMKPLLSLREATNLT